MKSLSSTALIALLAIALLPFSACRKGPDDPVISLRSRTARLTGVWKLANDEITTTTVRDGVVSKKVVSSFDGAFRIVVTTTYDGAGNPSITSNKYASSITWAINKDHTLKLENIVDGDSYVREGTWVWLEGNEKDLKDKEAVQFTITKYIFGGTSVSTSGPSGSVFVISRLANNELVVDMSNTTTSTNFTETVTGKQTFKQ